MSGFGTKTEERILRGIDVTTGDAALREALRALPADATEDDIYAVLAAHIPASADERRAGGPAGRSADPVEDLRGDLHTHTDLTDGIVSLAGMIAAAEASGYEYYAVTDHAPNLVMQRMTDEKMLAQRDELRALADTHRHGAAARQRAEHRARRLGGLGRGLPVRLRHLRRVGPLAASSRTGRR